MHDSTKKSYLADNSINDVSRGGFTPRDYLYLPGIDLDFEAQLSAIRGLLHRNHQTEQELADEIKECEARAVRLKGICNELAIDERADWIHYSIYLNAAHSMAAVGMLAPFAESIFYQWFKGVQRTLNPQEYAKANHVRWQRSTEDQWDCHFFWKNDRRQEHLVEGIFQLADAVGLLPRLPSDLRLTLEALFEYRNKMFHCGLEWPLHEREKFQNRIKEAKWPSDWFSIATSGDSPWIFYMTDTFINHCLMTIEKVLDAMGTFNRDELLRNSKDNT